VGAHPVVVDEDLHHELRAVLLDERDGALHGLPEPVEVAVGDPHRVVHQQ